MRAVLSRYPNKRVIAAFPPDRKSKHLRQVVSASFTIGQDKLRHSQLLDEVARADGYALRRPPSWVQMGGPRSQNVLKQIDQQYVYMSHSESAR